MGCTLGTKRKKKDSEAEEKYEKAVDTKKTPANGHSNGHAQNDARAGKDAGEEGSKKGEDTPENRDSKEGGVEKETEAVTVNAVKINGDVVSGEREGGTPGESKGEGKQQQQQEEEEEVAIPAEGEEIVVEKVEIVSQVRTVVQHTERSVVVTETKSEGGEDPAQHGAQMEDRFYNNKSFQKPDIDPTDPQQQEAALAIQTKYRQYHAKQVVQEKREDKAAVKIQAGFRGYQDRKEIKEGGIPAAEEEEAADINLDDPEVQNAATKIQAGFKGHKARKEVKAMKENAETSEPAQTAEEDKPSETEAEDAAETAPAESEPAAETAPEGQEEEEVDIDLNDPEVGAAAVKIQAGFKGFKARKAAKETQAGLTPPKEETSSTEDVIKGQEIAEPEQKDAVEEKKEEIEEKKEEAKKKKVPTATLR